MAHALRTAPIWTFFATCLTLAALSVGAADADFSKADRLIEQAVQRGDCPGAVLIVGRSAGVVYAKAYGQRALQPQREAMTVDTIFDMASLTKPVATATCALILIDRGQLDPKQTVAHYLPEFGKKGKEAITVEQLMLHRGGLIPDNPIKDYADGPAKAWEHICDLELKSKPGEKFAYSDVSFIVLGKVVEAVDPKHRRLNEMAKEEVFVPLGMAHTTFLPPADWAAQTAPTEKRDGQWIRGQVHDPRSYALGGVAGHAGLFSTGPDLARYCRMLLHKGAIPADAPAGAGGASTPPAPPARIFSEKTWELIATPVKAPDNSGYRSYGFDVKTGYSQPLGERFTPLKSFGHTGFTGTSFWVSPPDDAFVILLTNSVHPDGKGKVLALRRAVSTAVAEALLGPAPRAQGEAVPPPMTGSIARSDYQSFTTVRIGTLTGLDVLEAENFASLAGRKVALVTNHTGRDAAGRRTIDLLKAAPNVTLVALFSPEHGLYGKLDEKVGHGIDEKTGLKVWSLYGETRRPTDAMLAGVDTLVYDIQDVGTRFYTYPATMAYCMEECAKRNLKMVVLDRPNPIAPLEVDGPLADEKYRGFVAMGPLPLTHGLTVGELAQFFNGQYNIHCDLTVVPCQNWDHSMWWDATGLTWVNPSPNMRNLTQATVYPAVGMIEYCNISVGRGTDQPFELFGAPWVNGRMLAVVLNGARLPGVRFVPVEFTPTASKFKDQLCGGCYVLLTDRSAFRPALTGLTIAASLRRCFGEAFEIDAMAKLLASDRVLAGLKAGEEPGELAASFGEDVQKFRAARGGYLLYK